MSTDTAARIEGVTDGPREHAHVEGLGQEPDVSPHDAMPEDGVVRVAGHEHDIGQQ